jgi:hypothetical protein
MVEGIMFAMLGERGAVNHGPVGPRVAPEISDA